ncbi:MAG: outer membrane protein assembly factor BamA [Humidesulfovibrio sp.]|uniref:outer membrane protein assembly factor BamA n=1 Tax=Humidesulfovibrio sp. TaxID=2910988 RepID=UPI0027E631B5|nr:outer membrane protein assembly factor BamA [Humidesulfovibrio sp.]MDQ7835241.1 outer membrane protein assembly factor BamA [Humidesulfovibrio sp.]
MPRGSSTKFFLALAFLTAFLAVSAAPRSLRAAVTSPREVTVVVMPFEVNAGEDLKYLRQGLPDLLADRLREAGFTVIDKDTVQKALASKGLDASAPSAAKEVALLTNAGYAITGSFSKLGETLSIDARVTDPFGLKAPMPVFTSREGLINLLPAVDDLVTKMKGDLLGLERIVDIDVEGTNALDKDVVLLRLTTKKGEVLDAKAVNTDLKAVYDLGYFDDVKILLRDVAGGKKMVVQVVEKPRILALGVKGASEKSSDTVLKVVNSRKGAVLNPKVLAEDIAAIRELYRKDGYYNIKVSHEIESAGQGQARLNFVIEEGQKLYIKKITIEGAKQLSESELKDDMVLKERGLFSWFSQGGILKEDMLERDTSALAAYYNNRGFIDAKVGSPDIQFKEDGIYITFKVEEGARFRVEKVTIEGDLIADQDKLLAETKLSLAANKKDYLDRSLVRDDLKALTEYYNNFGYAYAEANVRMNDHPEEKTVDVIYVMRKLQKVYIRRVLIEGNTKTRDNVILREMRLADGALFNGKLLKRSTERLDKIGYFSAVDIEPVPTGNPEEMDLKIRVKDKDTGKIGGGIGYSTYDGVYFAGALDEQNMFGKGWGAGLAGQWGKKKTSYTFNVFNPRWDDSNLGVGLQAYNKDESYTDYQRSTIGTTLNFAYPVGEYTTLSWSYRLDRYDIYDVATGAASSIVDAEGVHIASAATASLSRNTTNGGGMTLPTEGTINTVSVTNGGAILGGHDNYIKLGYDFTVYQGLIGDLVIKNHAATAWVGRNWTNAKVPLGERFTLGGVGTVRGYSQRKISPLDDATGQAIGGDKMFFNNLDLLYPLSKKMGIISSVFFDMGNSWKEGEMPFSGPTRRLAAPPLGLYKSVGVGIQWFSPMGPLKLEFGYGLDELYESTKSKVEFSMGQTF